MSALEDLAYAVAIAVAGLSIVATLLSRLA